MYQPAHFKEERVAVLHQLIHENPLGALVSMTAEGLSANHIPFEIVDSPAPYGTLRAHVARANPLWKEAAGKEVMVIFQGADAYISPSWYPSKKEHGKVVPTWNYAVVHAHGPLKVFDDAEWLRAFVTKLTERHESALPAPWKVSDAPADYIDTMLKAIVGIEVPIGKLVGKWKVSQNRPAADRAGTIAGLGKVDAENARAMASLVSQAKSD
ncbi:MAG: FMN-binding negative transcriptional regulator [Betaproteobacteria bacterium]|nr:FMN-binding negative transcriptional regulator [Betaproteobacteria bacterium]